MYGRYAHENSLAFKEGFLNQPLINLWLKDFKDALKKKFPKLTPEVRDTIHHSPYCLLTILILPGLTNTKAGGVAWVDRYNHW